MAIKKLTPIMVALMSLYEAKADASVQSAVEVESDIKLATGKAVEGETHEFQAEVHRLMDIIINNLYSDKKVFLRELISNAADAVEKARLNSVSDTSYLSENQELEIKIEMDPEAKTLTIIDSGIGMTKNDLINNLGTVAKSGTSNFLEAMQDGAQSADSNLIGQFGVGFYSAFLVADKVSVTSKHNDSEQQFTWTSTANSGFTISEDQGESLGRGTRVTMYLKEDALDFTSEETVRELIKKFSQFVNFPIYLQTTKEIDIVEEEEEDIDADIDDDEDDVVDEEEDAEEKELKKKEEKKEKKTKEIVKEWDLVNSQKAIWVRPKDEITEEEYTSFYQAITKSTDEPLAHTHFSAEGDVEFKSLLYIPKKAEHDLMQSISSKKSDIKMYVRRVLVGEEVDELVPRYLNFVKGVVDSDDLPLNVSREQLQQSKVMKIISKKLTRKILEMLRKIAEKFDKEAEEEKEAAAAASEEENSEEKKEVEAEKKVDEYLPIWEQFGEALKWGTFEDDANRSKLMKLLRFQTSQSDGKLVSLQSVVNRMKETQSKIYFISGDDTKAMLKNPSMQIFNKKNIEVVMLTGNNDEHVIQRSTDFEGKSFQSVQKAGLEELQDGEEEKKQFKGLEKMFADFTTWTKDTLTDATTKGSMQNMGVKVDSVKISNRLVSSPMVVVASQFGYSPKMEAMMASQSGGNMDIMKMMSERKVIEINPYHPIINKISKMVAENKDNEQAKSIIGTLFQTALIESGFTMTDPSSYVEHIQSIMADAMGLDSANTLVEIEIPEEVEELEKEEEEEEEDVDEEVVAETSEEEKTTATEEVTEEETSSENTVAETTTETDEHSTLTEKTVEDEGMCSTEPPAEGEGGCSSCSSCSAGSEDAEPVDQDSTHMEL